jgi:hypothetical protein
MPRAAGPNWRKAGPVAAAPSQKGIPMNKPTLYVTFSSPGSHTFGPYASASLEQADYDYNVLILLVSATGDNPGDEDSDGHCLAVREDGLWKMGDGLDPANDGPGYTRVSIHQKRPGA